GALHGREEQREQDQSESGGLHVIPDLGLVTNLVRFLLASVSASLILGRINTMLPDPAPPSQVNAQPPSTNPDDQPLKMVVLVSKDTIRVWSVSGREGTLQQPKASFPRVGLDGAECDGAYMCESGTCDKGSCVPNPDATV